MQWVNLSLGKWETAGSNPDLAFKFQRKNMFLLRFLNIVGSHRDREVACSASDRQGSNFEFCVWSAVSSHSSHHPQEVLLAHFSLNVHKYGLKSHSLYFIVSTAFASECFSMGVLHV